MDALFRTMTAKPDAVLVLGPPNTPQAQEASAETVYRPGDAGDLGGYGVPVRLCFDGPLSTTATTSKDIARLPLAHTLAAWLLDAAGFSGQRLGVLAGAGSPALHSAGADDRRWALLVMGDGSARRTEKSPGWYDPDAIAFDDMVIAALTDGDGKSLLDLDVAVGERVLAAGLPSWRDAGTVLDGITMTARLHYVGAPFGVLYVVASWISAR